MSSPSPMWIPPFCMGFVESNNFITLYAKIISIFRVQKNGYGTKPYPFIVYYDSSVFILVASSSCKSDLNSSLSFFTSFSIESQSNVPFIKYFLTI